MPDFDRDFDFNHDGAPDNGHCHHHGGTDHGFFGHGGFVNYNHFERQEFFTTPSKNKNEVKGFSKFLAYLLYGGGVILIVLITWFILFS